MISVVSNLVDVMSHDKLVSIADALDALVASCGPTDGA